MPSKACSRRRVSYIDMYQNTWVSFGSWLRGGRDAIWVCVDTVYCVVEGSGFERRGFIIDFQFPTVIAPIGSDTVCRT